MPIVSNSSIVVTDEDRNLAREAIIEGYNNCVKRASLERLREEGQQGESCDCDLGAIDGCKAQVEAVAKMIALARKL